MEAQQINDISVLRCFVSGFCYFCFKLEWNTKGSETIGKCLCPVRCLPTPLERKISSLYSSHAPSFAYLMLRLNAIRDLHYNFGDLQKDNDGATVNSILEGLP